MQSPAGALSSSSAGSSAPSIPPSTQTAPRFTPAQALVRQALLRQGACVVDDLRFFLGRWYVACSDDGVWILEPVEPELPQAPVEPAASPKEPAASPKEPAASPKEPAASPKEPAASPKEPVEPEESAEAVEAVERPLGSTPRVAVEPTTPPADTAETASLQSIEQSPGQLSDPEVIEVEGVRFELVEKRILRGAVVALFVKEGALMALVRTGSDAERPVELVGAPAPLGSPPLAVAPEPPPFRVTYGRVVSRKGLHVVIDWGEAKGLEEEVSVEMATKEGRVIGTVVRVDQSSAVVRIGIGEPRPEPGDAARSTEQDPTRRLFHQPIVAHHGAITLHLRPAINVEESQGPMFSFDVEAYLRKGALRANAALTPMAFSDSLTYLAMGGVGFHESAFGVDAWLGSAKINDDGPNPPGTGLAFGGGLRVGSEDGFHFSLRPLLAVHRQHVLLADLFGQVMVPIGHNRWLLARGRAGHSGFALLEGGMRIMVRGDGGSGSFFIQATMGWTMTYTNETLPNDTVDTLGPRREALALGLGATWRF